MTAIGLALLLFSAMLVWSGFTDKPLAAEIRAAVGLS